MKKAKIGVIASFTPEVLRGDYFNQLLSGIVNSLAGTPHDLELILVKDSQYQDKNFKVFEEHDLDGVILLTWRIHSRFIDEAVVEKNIPVVVFNDPVKDIKASVVSCDNKSGVHMALRHILGKGIRKIGMLHAPDDASLDARERYDLLRGLLEEYQLIFEPRHYRKCDYFFEEDGYLKMMDMIHGENELPRAMICVNDDIAIGAMRALRENWIKCPEDVAVIGYDGIRKGKYIDPALTTVAQPLEQMALSAVEILIESIERKTVKPDHRVISPEIVIRQSC